MEDIGETEGNRDVLGRTYEYCIAQFAEKEGKGGGMQLWKQSCTIKAKIRINEICRGCLQIWRIKWHQVKIIWILYWGSFLNWRSFLLQRERKDRYDFRNREAYPPSVGRNECRRVAWWIIKQNGKRYYRYLRDNADYFTGEIAYHYDSNRNRYVADVILYIVT